MSTKIEPRLEDFFKAAEKAVALDPIGVADTGEVSLVDVDREGLYCTYDFCTSITEEERAYNQRVWGAFESAVKGAYVLKPTLQVRVDRICRRYGIDFNLAKEGNIPLHAEHVQKVGLGATRLFVQDLIAFAGENVDLYSLTREEIQNTIGGLAGPSLIANPSPSIDHVRGGPDECEDMVVFDPYRLDKKLAQLIEKVDDLLVQDSSHVIDFPYVDRIAKVATSLELEVGQILPAPVLVNGRTQVDYYEVYRKIGTGDGLVAYALRPIAKDSKLPASIYFRPTQITLVAEDAPESWFNDCEENIGQTGYRAAHDIFADLMKDERFVKKGEKIRLCGYSLGSTQASRFLVDFWEQVKEAILINGPSLDLETADRFRNAINSLPKVAKGTEPQLRMHIYRNKGDISSYPGNKHIGWGVELDRGVSIVLREFGNIPREEYGSFMGDHSTRPEEPVVRKKYHIEPIVYTELEQLNEQLDNFSRGDDVAWYERTRLFWGTRVLYMLVYGIYLLAKGILGCFGVQLFRSSRSEILPAAPIAELLPAENKA